MANQINTPLDWRLLAEDDLSVAEYLAANMRPTPSQHITFHCQQAAEKYLKGAVAYLGEEPPYTHDLEKLCSIIEKHRPSFVNIFTSCTIVTQFSIQPRYDRGLSISDDDMNLVLAHTKIIRDFLLKEIPDLFVNKDIESKSTGEQK
ncbi:MAG: HEPN domain-containing protein [Treponema sp.]|nr:HEPN domain-containing protein [Treponema sp.]MCL2251381.1 HEPN domain-containing protein [Treponema sp.]